MVLESGGLQAQPLIAAGTFHEFDDFFFADGDSQAWPVRDMDLAVLHLQRLFQDIGGEELRAVEGGGFVEVVGGIKADHGGERDVRIGQAAAEPEEAMFQAKFDLTLIREQAAATGRFHGNTIEHVEMNELLELNRADHAFVHQDGERRLFLERLIPANPVGADGGFQNVDSGLCQSRRGRQRGDRIVTAIGIGPEETIRSQLANGSGQGNVEVRVRRDLDVEMAVAAVSANFHDGRNVLEASDIDRPAQRESASWGGGWELPHPGPLPRWGRGRRGQELGEGLAAEFAGEIMERDVDAGAGDRHAGGKTGRDRGVHGGVGAFDVSRIAAEQGRFVIIPKSDENGFEGFVTPLCDGNALSPSDPSGIGGDPQDDRGAAGAATRITEKLEVSGHGIADGKQVDPFDAGGRVHGGTGLGCGGQGQAGGGGRGREFEGLASIDAGKCCESHGRREWRGLEWINSLGGG
jgi:hypothetical protein